MDTLKTGWLLNKSGEKFAPKTLLSQVSTDDGILLEEKLEDDLINLESQINNNINLSVENEKSERQVEISVERARIDNLIALEESSEVTDIERELTDIRVKIDGTISNTAGNAVREQINQLSSEIVDTVSIMNNSFSEQTTLEYAVGSIDANGNTYPIPDDSYIKRRLICETILNLKDIIYISKPTEWDFDVVYYDDLGNLLSISGWVFNGVKNITQKDIVELCPNAKSIKMLFKDVISLTLEDAENVSVYCVKHNLIETSNDSYIYDNKIMSVYNPYHNKGNQKLKGQLHAHTTNSDGRFSPEDTVEKYYNAGYDFFTITDHNVITKEPSNNQMLWLCDSYEDTRNSNGNQHMNIYNVDSVKNVVDMYNTTNTPQTIVDEFVIKGKSLVCYNHPEYPVTYASDETLENLPKGISFIEIWNGSIQEIVGTVPSYSDLPISNVRYGDMYVCSDTNKTYINSSLTLDSAIWGETTYPNGNLDRGFMKMLDNGHKVFCLATDDYHFESLFNNGWVVVFANSKTKNSIMNALSNGSFYASTGVNISDISFIDGVFSIDIENGDNAITTFYGYNNEVLKSVNGASAIYEMNGSENYVRAMVEIAGKKAWTQPIWNLFDKKQYEF